MANNHQAAAEHVQQQNQKRNRIWLLTFVSLFTSLLAFFVLIVSITELEGVGPTRSYQKIMSNLYNHTKLTSEQQGLQWLHIENTLTKGVRITIDSNLFESAPLFEPARSDINPRYFPYLNEIAGLLEVLHLDDYYNQYRRWIQNIEAVGRKVELTIIVEGHTDSHPMAPGARFRDNIELSAFRAYEVMNYLQQRLEWSPALFSIAGYGSMQPITTISTEPENRRIEIYISLQVVDPELAPPGDAL